MNAQELISIADMMAYMNSGKPFSITYVNANEQKGTGGAVKVIELAVKHRMAEDKATAAVMITDKATYKHNQRNPNHLSNGTVNIRVIAAGHADIKTVHVQLIRRFNGATVK